MATMPMTLSDPDSYFCCLKLFPLAYYIARTSYDISTHESKSARSQAP